MIGRRRGMLVAFAAFAAFAAFVAFVAFGVACSKSESAAPPRAPSSAPTPTTVGAVSACSATGEWAPCSVVYRLERAGLAPQLDSAARPEERSLHGQGVVIKIGQRAKLEVFLYPDSAARMADEKSLDRSDLVSATAPQTIKRERSLIENANLVGLLTSTNDHQRERVSDALTAGPPQPSKP